VDTEATGLRATASWTGSCADGHPVENDTETVSLLDSMFMTAPIGIAFLDHDLRFRLINAALANANDLAPADHMGLRLDEVIPSEHAERMIAWAEHVLDGGGALIDQEIAGPSVSGETRDFIASYYPVRNSEGAVSGVGIVVKDVTEHKRAERNARRALSTEVDRQGAALDSLQRMLLPTIRPVPGLTVDARYLPTDDVVAIGGDWYDCFPLDDGRVVLTVGDAVGHGLPAVQTMEVARNAIRSFLLTGDDPADALARANAVLCAHHDLPPASFATVIIGVLDVASGALVHARAGHPPAMLVRGDRRAELLEAGSGPPLGAFPTARYPTMQTDLRAGDVLVLYTDGLVERRKDATIDDGFGRLTAAVNRDFPPKALTDRLLEFCLGDDAREDDACVLVARLNPVPILR
jgi:PAS domain S-box-containing protein